MSKVLHIMKSLLPSGAEIMLHSSAKYWDSDLEKHILATERDLGSFAKELEQAGYHIHQIYNKNYFIRHYRVRKFLKKEKFDIIHIHRQGEACSYALDARSAGIRKIIRTVHNVFVFHGLVQIREFITRHIACMLGVTHVSISPSVSENERKRFAVKTVEIRNWYDDERFSYISEEKKIQTRKELGIGSEKYCIVSVGNCTPVKNHMSILKTLADYKNDPVFKNVLYLHIGKGKQEEEEKDFVKEHKIQHMVRFFGFDAPEKYLEAADLFVMPSVYEGFGISGIEGAATGIKTLFTIVPGLKDFQEKFPMIQYCGLDDTEIKNAIYVCVKDGKTANSIEQARCVKMSYGIADGVMMYERVYFDK